MNLYHLPAGFFVEFNYDTHAMSWCGCATSAAGGLGGGGAAAGVAYTGGGYKLGQVASALLAYN